MAEVFPVPGGPKRRRWGKKLCVVNRFTEVVLSAEGAKRKVTGFQDLAASDEVFQSGRPVLLYPRDIVGRLHRFWKKRLLDRPYRYDTYLATVDLFLSRKERLEISRPKFGSLDAFLLLICRVCR